LEDKANKLNVTTEKNRAEGKMMDMSGAAKEPREGNGLVKGATSLRKGRSSPCARGNSKVSTGGNGMHIWEEKAQVETLGCSLGGGGGNETGKGKILGKKGKLFRVRGY